MNSLIILCLCIMHNNYIVHRNPYTEGTVMAVILICAILASFFGEVLVEQ